MNKQCKLCGTLVPFELNFCQMCGSTEFIAVPDDNQTVVLNETNNPYLNNQTEYAQNVPNQQNAFNNQPSNLYNQQGWQPPVQQAPNKKKKNGAITAVIVIVVLLLLAGIGNAAEKKLQAEKNTEKTTTTEPKVNSDASVSESASNINADFQEQETEKESVKGIGEYTKGAFDGKTYTNEWADIKIEIPQGFSNADEATYAAGENSVTDCGAYFIADDTMSLFYICYEKLPSFPIYDEESYLDVVMEGMKKQTGVKYEISNNYSKTDIAGYTYTVAECNVENGYGDFVQSMYVRKIDGYIVFLCAISESTTVNNELVNTVTTVK